MHPTYAISKLLLGAGPKKGGNRAARKKKHTFQVCSLNPVHPIKIEPLLHDPGCAEANKS
jgi:hypothetical protein